MSARPILLQGGLVADFSVDGDPALRDVLVVGDTIAEIRAPGLSPPEGAMVVDVADRLLIPGLVNAHAHTHLVLAKSMAREWSLELHLNAGMYIAGNRTQADRALSAKLLAVESIRRGCTSCYDMFTEQPLPSVEGVGAVAAAYDEVGMRATIAPLMADLLFWDVIPGLKDKIGADLREGLRELTPPIARDWIAAYADVLRRLRFSGDLVRPAAAPLIPHHCTDALLVALGDFTREHDLSMHIHLAESKVQAHTGLATYGTTLTRHLHKLGLVNERLIAGHAIWIDDDDIACLADHGALVAHNPTSNLRLGSGLAPIRKMRDAGLVVGIGTDAPSCSDDANMFLALRSAGYIARSMTPDFTRWLDANTLLRMATQDGARILGRSDIGVLRAGYKADIAILRLDSYGFMPLNDIRHQLVYAEDGGSVESVMIGGRMVLDRGRMTTIDEKALRRDVASAVARLAEANAGRRALSASLEEIVAPHCRTMALKPYAVERYAIDHRSKNTVSI